MNNATSSPGTTLSTYADATPVAGDAAPDCAGGESFALLVLGTSMEPEFHEGEVIIIEPEGLVRDGCFVLAWHGEEWTFRQLRSAAGRWILHPLNPVFPDQTLEDLSAVRGVIIQKALPGRRRASKTYS